jgi:4,5-dihydroxyphthalate decarboxylase
LGKLPLTLAVSDYDHVRDLTSGQVQPDGIELTSLVLEDVEEIFFRFTQFREWDVSELSFGAYVSILSRDADLVAIPVFPSRTFRLSALYVPGDGGATSPQELRGGRVGVPNWAQTAGIYARGYLTHSAGVALGDVTWYQAGVNSPGRTELVDLNLPPEVSLTRLPDRTLDEMLAAGELDAAVSARPPQSFLDGSGKVRRLFTDARAHEQAYYRDTGIFPVMHLIALRRAVYERHPWIAMNLLKAFEEAKRRSLERLLDANVARFPLPWGSIYAGEARALLGGDLWPYGLEPNRPTLEAFLAFAHEQGVTARPLQVEELFPREVLERYTV